MSSAMVSHVKPSSFAHCLASIKNNRPLYVWMARHTKNTLSNHLEIWPDRKQFEISLARQSNNMGIHASVLAENKRVPMSEHQSPRKRIAQKWFPRCFVNKYKRGKWIRWREILKEKGGGVVEGSIKHCELFLNRDWSHMVINHRDTLSAIHKLIAYFRPAYLSLWRRKHGQASYIFHIRPRCNQ